jgi:glycosyltransferase involved in cell wall biosynthesis
MITSPPDVFVVIPAYNESKSLAAVAAPVAAAGYAVVVVDDGSQDDTWNVLETLPVRRLRHPINLGQGAALKTGMVYALRHDAKIVIHFDADGQHDYRQIPELIEPIEKGEADIVLGSRFLRAHDRNMVPSVKRAILRIGVLASWMASGMWLSDTHNGFRALSRRALETIRLHENGFAHATEILSEIRRNNLRCVERPVTISYSQYSMAKGQSTLNSLNIVIDLAMRRLFR